MTLEFRIGNKPGEGRNFGRGKKHFFFSLAFVRSDSPRILGIKQQASKSKERIAYRRSGTSKANDDSDKHKFETIVISCILHSQCH